MFSPQRLMIPTANLTIMWAACQKAAMGLIRDFGEIEHLQVSRKGPRDFVSKADKRSEKVLVDFLRTKRPDTSFLVEESGSLPGRDPYTCWVIDPLDGTTNFLHGFPHFAISIALQKQGKTQAGLVYNPVTDELFYAELGRGAFMNSHRLRVSGRDEMSLALVGVGMHLSNNDTDHPFFQTLETLSQQTAATRHMGSASLDLCYVAAGRLDGYIAHDLQLWDHAAAALIIKEAGGFENLSGTENTSYMCAGNEKIYKALLAL
jgi:myo-inositol-1(or 4)-monophosphatase